MDTERKIYGLLETVEQQQKSLQIAAEALDQTRHAIALLVEEVQEAAAAGASAGAAQALEQAGLLIAEAAKPTINELKQVTASAARVQYQFQKAAAWATWKHFALVAGGCAGSPSRRVDCGRRAAPRTHGAQGSESRARGADRHPAEHRRGARTTRREDQIQCVRERQTQMRQSECGHGYLRQGRR